MRRVRAGVGAVVWAAVVVLVAGCGSGEPAAEGKASPDPVVSETSPPAVEAEPEEPYYPPTKEGDFDKLADQKGWAVASLYETASAYVADICESMTSQHGHGTEPGGWLAERVEGDEPAVLRAGMPKLCPKWSKVALRALDGDYVWTYPDATYVVKAKPKRPDQFSDEQQEIGPGTYRVKGDLADCYWERTSRGGEILDNHFATSGQEITVKIRAGDGQFTSRDCGTWKPVK
ncbi:hypothetical protein [Streptomyces sp. NPDC058657]|uniref:hypothetical protein n=1 Tax=unclassified Streptomyces TaxID=2593676 RepID=UPI0036549CC8